MMLFLSRLLLLVLATSSNNVVSASVSDEDLLPEQLEDMVNDIEPAGSTSLRGHEDNGRELKNNPHAVRSHEKWLRGYHKYASYRGCIAIYTNDKTAQRLCHELFAAVHGKGDKSGVIKNIIKTIDDINDPNVVVDIVGGMDISLSDIRSLGKCSDNISAFGACG